MTLLEAWGLHKQTDVSREEERVLLEQQIQDLEDVNQQLTDMNAALSQQLEDANKSRTTPNGYVVDATGDDGLVIDEIIRNAQ